MNLSLRADATLTLDGPKLTVFEIIDADTGEALCDHNDAGAKLIMALRACRIAVEDQREQVCDHPAEPEAVDLNLDPGNDPVPNVDPRPSSEEVVM